MNFVDMMNREYNHTRTRTVFFDPIIKTVKSLCPLLLCLIVVIAANTFGLLAAETDLWVLLGALFVIAIFYKVFVMAGGIIIRLRAYNRSNKSFISKVSSLSPDQYEALLREHASAMRIEIFFEAMRRRMPGAETIYLTENFLFIPGYFLVLREDIYEICLSDPLLNAKTTFTFVLKDNTKLDLYLFCRYRVSNDTLSQIMMWFWQCEPCDPTLPDRVKFWREHTGSGAGRK